MINKLKKIILDYDKLSEKMSTPDIIANINQYTKLAKQHRQLSDIIPKANEYIKI